jgi:cytochrome c-type biogenesis protein CcmH
VRLLAALAAALALAAPALASEAHPTLNELEGEVMCPICHTTLDQSNSAAAQRIKAYIVRRIRAGDTKSQIEDRLVADFGPSILAQPPKKGFDLLAWLLPIGGLLVGAVAVGYAAWRWTRSREPEPALAAVGPLDPELERRLDDELRRFDE